MIGIGIVLILIGLIFLFVVPWAGIAIGSVGLAVAVLWVAGFERRPTGPDRHVGRTRV